jgi:hypothetical protein
VRCYLLSYSFFPYEIQRQNTYLVFFSNFVSCPSSIVFILVFLFSQFFTVSYYVTYLSRFFSFPLYFSQSVSVSYFLFLPRFFFTLCFRLSFLASFILLKIPFCVFLFLFSTLVFFGFVLTKFPPF